MDSRKSAFETLAKEFPEDSSGAISYGHNQDNTLNVLILGETGVGKSTWINGIANYVEYESLHAAQSSNDPKCMIPSRFTISDDELNNCTIFVGSPDGNENQKIGESGTMFPQSYEFMWGDQKVRFIDTPGIGDSRGLPQDKINLANIFRYIEEYPIENLSAIIILMQPNQKVFTPGFTYCISELFTHLPKSCTENVLFGFTGTRPFCYRIDIDKSLPWLQKSVRSRTIYFLGTFTNSNKEIIDFLLNSSWKCASAEVKLEWVSHMEGFIKALIKKFRTITTIENAIPSIWFSSHKKEGERLQLNYLLLDPEVTKLGPDDSRNAEPAYIVSNGRNRMQIEMFKRSDFEVERDIYDSDCDKDVQKLSISADSSKLDDVYDVVIKFSTIKVPMSSRKKVEIIDDSWIDALKFLSFAQWSKALFVSRQISRLVQRNVARLPCIVIDIASISWDYHLDEMLEYVTFFGDKILSEEFFTDLGISLDAPLDVQHKNVFTSFEDEGLREKLFAELEDLFLDTTADVQHENANVTRDEVTVSNNTFGMCIAGDLAGHRVASRTIFFANFGQSLTYSWAAMKYFLNLLYHPASYVKKVKMLALNQKLIDDCFGDAECFIRCGLCTWKGEIGAVNTVDVCESLHWMEKNIRAETILFPKFIELRANGHYYDQISTFLLDSSWKCARKEVKFEWICSMNRFLEALVKNFRSVSFVRNDTPTFVGPGYGDAKTLRCLLSAPNVLKLESENSRGAVAYIISNGDNRMQIEMFKRPNSEENQVPNYVDLGDSDIDDSYDDSGDGKMCFLDVNVKVYHV